MPLFDNDNVEEYKNSNTGHYGFSAVKMEDLEDLGATEYTLVTVVIDVSGSTYNFRPEMEATLKEVIKACRQSPRADFLLLRIVFFGTRMEELHGFMPLAQCDPDKYNSCCSNHRCGGSTALYDSVENAIKSSTIYATQLANADYNVNGIVVIITDGDDTDSVSNQQEVKEALQACITSEQMESLVSILVGVNIQSSHIAAYLDSFQKNAGFTQFVKLEDANATTLAKLADFVSRSISSQSQSLGSGSPSQSLVF